MDINSYYFKTINNTSGLLTRSQRQRDTLIQRVHRDFTKSLDVEEFIFWKQDGQNDGLDKKRLILVNIYNQKSTVNGQEEDFTVPIDTPIVVGDLIYSVKQKAYWYCTYSTEKDYIYRYGKLTKCNGSLRWQNEEGNFFEYPIIDVNSTQFNSGNSENKQMAWGTAQHRLTIAVDENTLSLKQDKRFFVDKNIYNPKTYKLTQNDTSSQRFDKGLLSLTMVEDQYNEDTDSLERWICDYKEPQMVSATDNSFEIKGFSQKLFVGGSSKSFIARTENSIHSWSIEGEAAPQFKLERDDEERKCYVTCIGGSTLIGFTIYLRCEDSAGRVGRLPIKITGGV